MNKKHKRRNKLPKPGIQLRLIGAFAAVAALSLLFQAILVSRELSQAATTMPTGGQYLTDLLPELLLDVLGISFAVLFPLVLVVGVLSTFRVAGPIRHFEDHLGRIARGEAVEPCRLRRGDDLKELCARLNEATAALQGRIDAAEAERSSTETRPSRAA